MTETEKAEIDAMTHEQLARLWRHAPLGDPFWAGERGKYASERFRSLGPWTPSLSKKIGW